LLLRSGADRSIAAAAARHVGRVNFRPIGPTYLNIHESVLSTINLRTKLEMFSFAHSKDMKGAQNIYTRLVTTTTSILAVVCHLKPNTSYGLSPSKI